jgi:hypothetical protein
MIEGTLIAESLRTGTNLENLRLTVRKISRYQAQVSTPDQPPAISAAMTGAGPTPRPTAASSPSQKCSSTGRSEADTRCSYACVQMLDSRVSGMAGVPKRGYDRHLLLERTPRR